MQPAGVVFQISTTCGVSGVTPGKVWSGAELAGAARPARRQGPERRVERGRVVVRLATDRGAALGADVVVLAAAGEHEQELLARRRRPPAARAEEARGLELLELVAGARHRADSTRARGAPCGGSCRRGSSAGRPRSAPAWGTCTSRAARDRRRRSRRPSPRSEERRVGK